MTESPDGADRCQRARVAAAELEHSHHRGDRADGHDGSALFLVDVRYDSEEDVSYALSEDRFGEAWTR